MAGLPSLVRQMVRSYQGGARSVSRNMLNVNQTMGAGSASGYLDSVDEAARSATIQRADGTSDEYFFQNRYVREGEYCAAIGLRII